MQSIRKYLLVDEIIDLLEKEKGLLFDSKVSKEKFKTYLIQYNYNFFVKCLRHKLMFDEKGKYKKEFDSNQVRYLFDIDRRISTIIFKYFKSFELLLNNAITSILSKEINRKTGIPYIAALPKNDFLEIFENYTQVYRQQKKINSSDLVINQNFIGLIGEFFKNYSSINFYDELSFKNKDSEPKEIIDKISNAWFLKNKDYLNICGEKKKDWIYIEFFSLTFQLSFSQLIRIFKSLNNNLKNQVIKFFCQNLYSKRKHLKLKDTAFISILEMFSSLRNKLAHNDNITKFKYNLSAENIDNDIIKILGYKKEKNNNFYIFNLNDLIIFMQKFLGTNKIIEEIQENINNKIEISLEKGNHLSDLIFEILENESGLNLINKK